MHRLLPWLVLYGCTAAPAPPDLDDGVDEALTPRAAQPPPPHGFSLRLSNLVAGGAATFTITGAPPSTAIELRASLGGGLGDGPCPPTMGGLCLDILPTIKRLAFSPVTDAAGAATFDVHVPSRREGQYIALQAAVRGPTPLLSNPVARPIGAAGTPIDPNVDGDGDGATPADGDCADFDPAFHPDAPDVDGDAVDHNCDDLDRADADRDDHIAATSGGDDCDDHAPTVFAGHAEVCDGADNDCDGPIDEGVPTDGNGCAEPEPPTFPSVIGTLHITTRTGTAPNDKTDDNPLYLCLTATDCWRLDELEYDNFELGAIETFMIEDVNLPRSAVDRVELRSTNGADAWRAACVQVVFDGDPVYCSEPDVFMGAGQTLTWTDPLGLHNACTSCFSSALTHGPILGPPSPDGPRIWFRADARRRTEVVIAPTHEGLDSAAPIAVRYPDYARDLTDVVQVDGLAPDTTWHYRVDVDGLGSYDGTFRTAPVEGASTRFKLAFGSTAELASQPVFTGIAAAGPDMFLFAGDNHFGHTKLLPDQREYYRAAHRIGPRAALTANVPTVAIWNDDDYAAVGGDVSSPGKADVLRAFTEYWPNLYFGTDDTDGVFSKVSYGDIDLFLLDGRYWRDATSLLGAAQLAWLEGELLASNATFKLVALGSQWSHEAADDGWAGYPVAWEDFTGFLADEAIDGVVLLSGGGGHREVRVTHAAPGGYGVPEVVSSALASAATACPTSANETIACADGGDGFAMLDIDTTVADPTLTITLRDVGGAAMSTTVLHRSALESYDPPADPGVDINGDGYGDVVFGIPGENNGAGAIGVVFGSPGGADSWGDAWWSQASPDVPGDEETNDNFGAALAVGDFDADGFDDIAVGIPLEDIGTIEHGYAEVLYGGPTGIVSTRTQDWRQAYNGIGDAVEAGDRLGAALAAGDFNGDGYDELVIGVPGESNGGQIQILFGSAAGLTSVGNQTWYQSINGTGSADEAGDRFGATLEVGDFDADGYEDLAIGAPDEGVGALASAGAVTIMYGSATGIVNTRSLAFNGNSVPGVAEASDKLGQALAAGDLNGDGYDDLLVGVPFEDLTTTNCGAFLYLAGSASGVTTASAVLLSYDLPAFGHPAAANDQLGAALAIADIDGDGYADAVIGAPGRAVSGFASAGELLVMYGSASGPSTSRFRFMSQLDTTNAGPEANDQFAATLSAADLDGDGYADVIIGAPGEAIGAITSAGLFHTMYGSAAGLLSGGQRWHQDVALIEETVETSDRVGAALP